MVVESLHQEGVEVVFGYPGGAIMNVYDEIYKQNYFQHILNRHEQASPLPLRVMQELQEKLGLQ